MVNDGRFLSVEALEQIKGKITEVIRSKGFFTISDCMPTLGYGRTVAIPILEYLDKVGFTVRLEEGRTLKEDDRPKEAE
jgi:selenocysteine-specific elongation factor